MVYVRSLGWYHGKKCHCSLAGHLESKKRKKERKSNGTIATQKTSSMGVQRKGQVSV